MVNMIYVGSEYECPLCGSPMDDEEGECHWYCAMWENMQADLIWDEVELMLISYEEAEKRAYG